MSLLLFGNRTPTARPTTRRRHEAIDMRARRFGYFPRTFLWRGHEYQAAILILA
jgi:hypothetical protein